MSQQLSSYLDLIAQRDALDAKISAARDSERSDRIAQIKQMMLDYGIAVTDLQDNPAKRKKNRDPAIPKYRDPKSGKTWSGRGRQPQWIGDEPSQYLIQPDLPSV